MRTIAFYSYKGGAGRTLLMANFAHGLARAGRKVVAMDLDLEAPGLHHKIVQGGLPLDRVRRGLVELVADYDRTGTLAEDLRNYTVEIDVPAGMPITVLPAGGFASEAGGFRAYWQRLETLAWPHLTAVASGKLLFFELRQRIEAAFAPDFLLVDAQTGLTELGGIATAVLADAVVALSLTNDESLRGTSAIIRAVRESIPPPDQARPAVFLVLTRQLQDPSQAAWSAAREILGPEMSPLVLHQDAAVHQTDAVLLDNEAAPMSPLAFDYLDALHAVAPEVDLAPVIDPLLAEVAVLERDSRTEMLARLASIQLTPRLLMTWLQQQQPARGASYLAGLALTYGVASLASPAEADDAVDHLLRLAEAATDGSGGAEAEVVMSALQRHQPGMTVAELGRFLLEDVLPTRGNSAPIVALARELDDEPSTAETLLRAALNVLPHDEALLAALSTHYVDSGDNDAALRIFGAPPMWSEMPDPLRARVAPTLALAAARAHRPEWAAALLPDLHPANAPAPVRASLLHMTGDAELAELLLAGAIGEVQRFPSQVEELVALSTALGLADLVDRIATALLGATRTQELLRRIKRPSPSP